MHRTNANKMINMLKKVEADGIGNMRDQEANALTITYSTNKKDHF
jgi:hypothetical protein